MANNIGESSEQEESIDSLNDPPVVKITSTFQEWEGGQIIIDAEASDEDGSTPSVAFEYSVDSKNWTLTGVTSATPPTYSTRWDTKTVIPDVARTVWLRAAATDADDKNVVVTYTIPESFGVDNQPPVFGEWTRSPENLTEDTTGSVRVQVSIEDGTGSGVQKAELSYRIGTVLQRSFQEMRQESGNLWYIEIPEPAGKWDKYRGETLYYKAYAADVVGNRSPDTLEQQELIDDINDPPRGLITSAYKTWERGDSLLIRASAVDDDGQIVKLQFQYSTNNVNWADIGAPLTTSPYSVIWNTTSIDADPDVWLRASITDDDNAVESTPTVKLGIDNKPPVFSNWSHNNLTEDFDDIFRVEVEINDQGSGVDSSQVQIRYRIGKTSAYTEYQNMFRKTGTANVWFYEIPRPIGNWSNFAGETLTYMVKAADAAGNLSESTERSEFIEPTTGSISGTVTPRESWFKGAKVSAQQNGIEVKQVSVSQIDGGYSVKGLRPGVYDLMVTATGYGIDRSVTGVTVTAGKDSTGYNVELYTYTVMAISRAQGGIVEFQDESLRSYKLTIPSNTLDGQVVLGFSGSEPTSVPNPEVSLMGVVGVGFKGRIDKEIQLIVSRPVGISDGKSIMTFIYNGTDYRFVNRADITQTAATITVNLTPDDVQGFSDRNHNFTKLSTSDTVFYCLITRFDEPQISATNLGIRNPESPGGLNISTTARRIALIIHGITTDSDDLTNMTNNLTSLTDNQGLRYYDHVLVFNYDPSQSLSSSSITFQTELNKLSAFTGKLDVVAHGMGGLIARKAITSGWDSRIGSLTMLGTPHDGVDDSLLKGGYTSFLKKTSSDPAWTYYRDGWQDILQGSLFLANLNSQSARTVNTHYYGIGTDDIHDGLLYESSATFLDNIRFPHLETPLTERFEPVPVSAPLIPGPGFMSNTKHVAMVNSSAVIDRVSAYLLGKSSDIVYERYEGEITPGERTADFKVELENVGTGTVYGVSAKLSTTNTYIRKYSGAQGIEVDTASFGDIPAGGVRIGTFSFDVSSNATSVIGSMVTFSLTIANSRDNSIAIEEFEASIGGNLIRIALDQSGNKRVEVDVQEDASRPDNDGDIAVEPGEIMVLNVTLKNNSSSTFYTVIATLKTTDTRVVGLNASGVEIPMSTGISISYGSLPGNATTTQPFKYVKIKPTSPLTPSPTYLPIHFTLDIKSSGNFIGSDEFDVKVGSDIIVDEINVDEDLIPGGPARDIDVQLRNISADDIDDVEVEIDWSPRVATIPDRRQDIGLLRSGRTEDVAFSTSIDAGFAGYIEFTLEIRMDNDPVNIETFSHYFGMRTQYATHWIVDDDNDNGIAEPGEEIWFQIERWNPTSEITRDVEVELSSADVDVISITEELGDYGDISAGESEESSDEFEFTVADAVNEDTGVSTSLTATRLQRSGANWIPDVFIGGKLNPNTTSGDPQYQFDIVDNGDNWIDVSAGANMLDPDNNGIDAADPHTGDPFLITIDGNTFDLEGRTVGFALDVTEDRDLIGQEDFTMRVGGKIRYLPPRGFDQLKGAISDRTGLGPLNNGNSIPEPGEIIEISVTLINISDDNIDDVEARLDEDERGRRIAVQLRWIIY